jgi:hypothetical protein
MKNFSLIIALFTAAAAACAGNPAQDNDNNQKIRQFEEIENDRFRSLVGDAPTQKDKDQQELLKKKKVLLEKQIKTLHERKSKLEKGATA